MKRLLVLLLVVVLAFGVIGCSKRADNIVENVQNYALAEKFDNYMDSFTDELDDYLDRDFESLRDGARRGDISAKWVNLFNSGKEKIGHMSSEYAAAQMIVPEHGQREYNMVAGVVSALENLFNLYSDLTEEENATPERVREFCDAAEAILVVWDNID